MTTIQQIATELQRQIDRYKEAFNKHRADSADDLDTVMEHANRQEAALAESISCFKATSLKDVAIQTIMLGRILEIYFRQDHEMSGGDGEGEPFDQVARILYSIVDFIEAETGENFMDYCRDAYLTPCHTPWKDAAQARDFLDYINRPGRHRSVDEKTAAHLAAVKDRVPTRESDEPLPRVTGES